MNNPNTSNTNPNPQDLSLNTNRTPVNDSSGEIHRTTVSTTFHPTISHTSLLPPQPTNMAPESEELLTPQQTFTAECQQTFHKTPYQWQIMTGSWILHKHLHKEPIRTLLIRPTGGGKTLVYITVAKCIGGVTLCISPLLALGADQFRKVFRLTTGNPRIAVAHLDELTDKQLENINVFLKDRYDSRCSLILYTSPQCISQKLRAKAILSTLTSCNLISFVVVDEIHLYTRYGLTFRSEFLKLKKLLFQKLHSVTPMLFMTATCTDIIRQAFEKLTGVFINNFDWPSGIAMSHRTVGLELKYTVKTTATSIAAVKNTLSLNDNLPKKFIIYTETRGRCTTIQERLGKALDAEQALHKHDVIELLGTMPKEKKTKLIECFMDDDGPSILCATSGVGNAGIDSKEVRLVIRLDFPRNIIDICQEKGRAGRLPGATAEAFKFLICISLESFIDMYKMILLHDEDRLDPSYQQQEIQDLLHIACIFSSSYCTTALLEHEMSNPFVRHMPNCFPPACGICNNCRGSHVFPAINRFGLHRVLFHLFAVGPHNINGKRTVDTVVKALCNYPQVNMLVFRSTSTRIQPQKLKQVLFMVISTGIVELFVDNNELCLRLAATQQEGIHDYAIRDDHRWQSFRLV